MSIRILLVDDDLQVLRMVAEALEWKGYSMTTASSGENAVNKARNSWASSLESLLRGVVK